MASSSQDEDVPSLPSSADSVPVSALNVSTRVLISNKLDAETESVSESGYIQDYRGLAELIGFTSDEIGLFRSQKKTQTILQEWTKKDPSSATIRQLWDYFLELQCFNIVCNAVIHMKVLSEIEIWQKKQTALNPAIQKPLPPENHADEYKDMTTGKEFFDAFVSYAHEDLPFVQELLRTLEDSYGLSLCITARDLVAGTSENTVTAKIIADKCRKILIILSPNFLRDMKCDFQLKFAQSLSPGARQKKVLPIILENCEMPLILRIVAPADYTNPETMEYFWPRLSSSIQAQSHSLPDSSAIEDESVKEMAYPSSDAECSSFLNSNQ